MEPLSVDRSVKNIENLLLSAILYYIILLANAIKFRGFAWILSFPRNVLYVLCQLCGVTLHRNLPDSTIKKINVARLDKLINRLS